MNLMNGGLAMQRFISKPFAQREIEIVSEGTRIRESTFDIYAEYNIGDKSTGDPEGWIVTKVMWGDCNITNEIDLEEMQEYVRKCCE